MKTTKLMLLFLALLCFFSCTNDSEADLILADQQEENNDDPESNEITYENTVRAIIQNSCVGCHDNPPRNGAPFSLINYQQVSNRSGAILNAMSRQNGAPGAMPPSGRLPQNTIDMIQQWIDNGLPEN
ncbi:hypothetical protein ACFSQJ_07255 [Croceitalea marina]|uniref:Cytochrome c domain-containing protein n=1 Tax=Croceitalea marina TaxID=1775166 RepID=A0ABW5MVG3_9FLAO